MGITSSGPAAAGAGLNIGELLFSWNGTDLTQFDTPFKDFERDLGSPGGGNAETALIATVIADPLAYFTGNIIRFTGTALAGGGILAISTAALTLPSRFVLVYTIRGVDSGSINEYGSALFNDDVVDDMQGWLVSRVLNQGNCRSIVNNRYGSAEALVTSGSLTAAAIARGGVRQIVTVERRPAGEATALSLMGCEDLLAIGNPGGPVFDTVIPHLISGVNTNWDTHDFNRVGLTAWEGNNGSTFVLDFKNIAVYAHPDD